MVGWVGGTGQFSNPAQWSTLDDGDPSGSPASPPGPNGGAEYAQPGDVEFGGQTNGLAYVDAATFTFDLSAGGYTLDSTSFDQPALQFNVGYLAAANTGTIALTITGANTFTTTGILAVTGEGQEVDLFLTNGAVVLDTSDDSGLDFGQFSLTGGAFFSAAISSFDYSEAATLTVASSTLELGGQLYVGPLNVTGGATLSTGSDLDLCANATIDGSSVYVGGMLYNTAPGGPGPSELVTPTAGTTLSIQNGASVTAAMMLLDGASASASATILTGQSSNLNVTGDAIVGEVESAVLSIVNGAAATIGGDLYIGLESAGFLGLDSTGNGTIDIDGTGSGLTVKGDLLIGYAGVGELDVGPGGSLMVWGTVEVGVQTTGIGTFDGGDPYITGDLLVGVGGAGLWNVTAGDKLHVSGSIVVGVSSGATGTLDVHPSAQADTSHNAIIGKFGAGTLLVEAGGTFSASPGTLIVGYGADTERGEGFVNVGTTAFLLAGTLIVGGGAFGTLQAFSGATVDAIHDMSIGQGSEGAVELTGLNTTLEVVSNFFDGTAGGDGDLLSVGGSISVGGTATVGAGQGSDGDLTVNGGTIGIAGTLYVGENDCTQAVVSIGLTAAASADGIFLGVDQGSIGTLDIQDPGTATKAKDLVVGDDGTGDLNLTASASFDVSSEVDIAEGGSSDGTLTVQDATLTSDLLFVGGEEIQGGRGTLVVTSDVGAGVVSVTQAYVWNYGVVSLQGGTLLADSATIVAGGSVSGYGLLNAHGTLAEDGTTNGSLVNDGRIETMTTPTIVGATTLELGGPISGTGTLIIEDYTVMQVDDSVAASQSLYFVGFAADELALASPIEMLGTIARFGEGDTIDLLVTPATTLMFANGTLDVLDHAFTVAALAFAGQYVTGNFLLSSDHNGGSLITWQEAPCFVQGTRLLTARGEIPVEDLVINELMPAHFAGMAPIRWIGYRPIDCRRHRRPETIWPVLVRPDSFGPGQPRRDLWLSPDHAVFVDEVLVPIRQLVNGATIVQMPAEQVTYCHVELARHDVVMAEGLAVESYLDTGNRAMFANGGAAIRLQPDFATVDAGGGSRQGQACAPFAVRADQVEPIWQRLATRAAQVGYAPPVLGITTDAALRLEAGGRVLWPLPGADGAAVFAVPPGTEAVRLVSRAAAPCGLRPWLDDRRRLGVAVGRIKARCEAMLVEVPVDHPALGEGWHGVERAGGRIWRWTDGNAVLAIPPGTTTLEIVLAGMAVYPATVGALSNRVARGTEDCTASPRRFSR